MTYKDKTWCSHRCGNRECYRNFTPEEVKMAEDWWKGSDFPIAFSDLKTEECGYISETEERLLNE